MFTNIETTHNIACEVLLSRFGPMLSLSLWLKLQHKNVTQQAWAELGKWLILIGTLQPKISICCSYLKIGKTSSC